MPKKSQKTKKKPSIGLYILLLLLLVLVVYYTNAEKEWYVTSDGILQYPQDRGRVEFTETAIQTGDDYVLKKVVYRSRDLDIHALLRIPKSDKAVPAVVIAPGAEVLKEGRQDFADSLARMGYASIVMDQRTFGETGGASPPLREDIESFKRGVEPVQHRFIYDILRAGDVLRAQPEIDPTRIAFIGESMGGRFVIIAGAIDEEAKGVIAISTGGFGFTDAALWNYGRDEVTVLRSIDPDSYADKISPRKLVMFHFTDDNVVPIQSGEMTFKKALEPKEMYILNGTHHGYSGELDPFIEKELEEIFK
jgi:dienelactone hydrolase